jgi:hypothetical protein
MTSKSHSNKQLHEGQKSIQDLEENLAKQQKFLKKKNRNRGNEELSKPNKNSIKIITNKLNQGLIQG